jgi:nucleoside-diphosphate-sugar epimerase
VMSEEIIQKKSSDQLEWVILRFATVFGWSKRMRFDLALNFLTAKALLKKQMEIIGPEQWRPLIHVEDVAKAVVLTAFEKKGKVDREIFNVGGNLLNIQIRDMIDPIRKQIKAVKIKTININPEDKRSYKVSFEKINSIIGFSPKYKISDGVGEIIKNLKKENINFYDDKYYNVKYLFKHLKND